MDNRNFLNVTETFQGKTVLITGATGFLGKLTLEKLLRTCPKIKKIYILVRAKKGKDQNQRRNEILDSEIFESFKRNAIENFKEKVEVIAGDLIVSNLGISQTDQMKIFDETNFVFHLAATVRFDEKIKTAVQINVKGARDILKLAKQMKCLQAFVYVSTAYSFCPRKEIDEKFYDPPYDVDKLINIVDSLDDDLLEYITPKMLKDWPNTYVLTKSVAEHVIKTESDGLPCCIVRPSIVVSTYREPLPGWTDNLYGATGSIAGGAVGLIKTLWVKPYKTADIVPADYVVNCTISAAWDISNNRGNCTTEPSMDSGHKDNKIKIYNYVSGPENPITWAQFYEYSKEMGKLVPSKVCLWYYCFVPAPTEQIYKIYIIFLHIIPAYIVDFIAKHTGRKPQLVKGYQKIHKFSGVIHYFAIRQWKFENENTRNLWKKLKAEDRIVFPFSMTLLNWEDYFQACMTGIRLYILKDPMDTLEEGKAHYRKLKIYHYAVVFFVCLLVVGLLGIFLNVLFSLVW